MLRSDFPARSIGWVPVGLGLMMDEYYARARDLDSSYGRQIMREFYFRAEQMGFDTTLSQSVERPMQSPPPWSFGWNMSLAHGKAYAVCAMLRDLLGPEKFQGVIKGLLATHAGGLIHDEDLVAACEAAVGEPLDWFVADWINGRATLDYEISNVVKSKEGWDVLVKRLGTGSFPVVVQVTTDRNEKLRERMDRTKPVALLHFKTADAIKTATIDPDGVYPDLNALNNIWPRSGPRPQFDRAIDSTGNVEVVVTGSEQTAIDRLTKETDRPIAGSYSNSLDHAFAVLAAKVYPQPDLARMVRATIDSLCREFERRTASEIAAQQRDSWGSDALQTDFATVLHELVALDPERTDQQRLIEAGLTGMLNASGWEFASLLPQVQAAEIKRLTKVRQNLTKERGVLGLRLDRWPELDVVLGAPAAEAGIQKGDVALTVDGRNATDVKTAEDALKLLQGPPGGIVHLVVQRSDRTLNFDVQRASTATRVEVRQINPNILLIAVPTFEGAGIGAAVRRHLDQRAESQESVIILDLRNNGGGRAEEANAVADIFLDDQVLQICEFRRGRRIEFKSKPGAIRDRVILLTNKQTASAAEMLAMALHDQSRAIIVGERTAGALFGKDIAELTGGQTIIFRTEPTVLSPIGRDYSNGGIAPDVDVSDTREDQHDEILSRALELAR